MLALCFPDSETKDSLNKSKPPKVPKSIAMPPKAKFTSSQGGRPISARTYDPKERPTSARTCVTPKGRPMSARTCDSTTVKQYSSIDLAKEKYLTTKQKMNDYNDKIRTMNTSVSKMTLDSDNWISSRPYSATSRTRPFSATTMMSTTVGSSSRPQSSRP